MGSFPVQVWSCSVSFPSTGGGAVSSTTLPAGEHDPGALAPHGSETLSITRMAANPSTGIGRCKADEIPSHEFVIFLSRIRKLHL